MVGGARESLGLTQILKIFRNYFLIIFYLDSTDLRERHKYSEARATSMRSIESF